jgi:hypothetical protein
LLLLARRQMVSQMPKIAAEKVADNNTWIEWEGNIRFAALSYVLS